MSKKKIFIIIGIFWILILAGFVIYKEYTLGTGTEILIKTVPVDPRDLFRGDYVVLRYDISNLTVKNEHSLGRFGYKLGDNVYLPFTVGSDNTPSFKKAIINKPKDSLFIKGEIINISEFFNIDIEYGIESYFVPEGEGKEIEKNLGEIYAKVIVDGRGNAVLKGLVLDGKDIEF